MMEEENKKYEMIEKVMEQTERKINEILEEEINLNNVDYLFKLIDIHKDMCNEKYWKIKEENYMRYRTYSGGDGNESYGRRGVAGTGRRYRDNGSYGRRGVDARYRGDDMMNDIYESYMDYVDSSSYGHEDKSDEAYKFMVEKGIEFVDYLDDEAKTPMQRKMMDKFRQEVGNR